MLKSIDRAARIALIAFGAVLVGAGADASDFREPWKRPDRALVIDAYEYNPIDWPKLASDKRIVGFINKGSDGLSPPYECSGDETEVRLCKALWKRHAVARELFHTRRTVAKALGLKWGAYHLGRPGNPIDQANNFIDFAEPAPDDLIALDIEENDPEKWMSLEDAETFARHIHTRLGRWPVLYTNGSTALHIAENRERYKLLSRLPLWYARYKPAIGLHFPKGNWQTYTLWQFAAGVNCDASSCPYRVPGTPLDIDVNVASMSADELRAEWPFGELVEETEPSASETIAKAPAETVPVPVSRRTALNGGDVTVQFVEVGAQAAEEVAIAETTTAAETGEAEPDALRQAETPQNEVAEVVVETGETVPLPIWRREARRKRGEVTVKFVSVERVMMATTGMAGGDAPAARASPRRTPFQALLGEQPAGALPVELAGYAEVAEKARDLGIGPMAEKRPKAIPAGQISAAALDDPGPVLSAARFSRRDLPVFLLKKIDGPDEPAP